MTGAAQTTSPPADAKSRDLANVGFNHADRPPGDITKVPSAGKSLPVTTAGDDLLIFGPPVKGRTNTYAFNNRYEVQVEKKDGRILSIFLTQNDKAPASTKLTEAEMRDFYRKVKVFGDIGKPVFAALWTGGNYYEYLYENGKIDKFFITKDDGDRVYTSQIRVLFPYKVNGQISTVDGEGPVRSIKIGKCYYYCFTQGIQPGDTGDFFVIGPSNGHNGECFELNL